MAENSITQDRLKEVLHYDPETGVFTWIKSLNPRAPVGKIVSNLSSEGYIRARIDNNLYFAHRLAFLYMDGTFPKEQTDHINGVRSDNRWINLRRITHSENGRNQRLQPTNKSGHAGVFWSNTHKRWIARIKINGKTRHILQSKDKQKVIDARKLAENELGFHKNHGSRLSTDPGSDISSCNKDTNPSPDYPTSPSPT